MSDPWIYFLVLNIALVAYFLLRQNRTSKSEPVSFNSNELPGWIQSQLEDAKLKLEKTEDALRRSEEELKNIQIQSAKNHSALSAELTASQERLQDQKNTFETQKKEAAAAKEQMTNEFKVLASQVLEEKSTQFKATNSEAIDKLLAPFKQKLTDFESTVKESHKEELKNTGALMANIQTLQNMNAQLSAEASGLAKALRGDTKKQGNWGEFVLERALEMSGLGKDKEYFVQNSETTADGKRLQPDVIIQLPGNKKIIIDSKVSLVSWDNHVNAENDELAQTSMKALVVSIQNHIKGLGEKDYPQLYGGDTPEFVLLFIPIEAAFMEATKFDGGLYEYAFSRKIILVSTSTLLATLKTIAMAWRQEKQTKNVIEIAEAGGKLYDKFVGLSEDLTRLGQQFKTAQNTYQDTMNKMVEGRGNLISQVERLKKLGSKTKKELDNRLVDRADLGEYSDKKIEDKSSEQ